MNQEAVARDCDLNLDTRKTKDEAISCGGSERSLSERIRSLLSKLAKMLEGDHEFHKYLGM
jgi:hypothetical protein